MIRLALFVAFVIAVFMFAVVVGLVWHHRPWPTRTAYAGVFAILCYGLAGQIKAFIINIPVDAVSVAGLASVLLFDIGLAWVIARSIHEEA